MNRRKLLILLGSIICGILICASCKISSKSSVNDETNKLDETPATNQITESADSAIEKELADR